MGKIAKIAMLLGKTEDEALQFCRSVQSKFGPELPSYKMIEQCLRCHPEARSDPERVYEILRTIRPNGKIRPTFIPDTGHDLPKPRRQAHSVSEPHPAPPPQKAGDIIEMGHNDRQSIDTFAKCPHGVPKIRTCAICDPRRFQQENNMD